MTSTANRKLFSLETFVYICVWTLLFVAPILMEAYRLHHGDTDIFEWNLIGRTWLRFLPFLLLFVLHNWLLAPILVHKQKRGLYLAGVVVATTLFTFYECAYHPAPPADRGPSSSPPLEERFEEGPPLFDDGFPPPHRPRLERGERMHNKGHKPPVFREPELMSLIIVVLMLGMNLGLKFYFKQRDDVHRLEELERKNLEQKLTYLRYQVNPHFLMNTLNNIHALVDINPEEAQSAIVELSRLLRYVLYDGEHQLVSLQHEVEFLGHYIALMRLRYTEMVDIRVEKPTPLPSVEVPPLLFATFVENAFKHGVSYRQPSFVHIRLQTTDARLLFDCSNSIAATPENNREGGLGLRNVKQRLELLFQEDYTLDIQETDKTYEVHLDIPLKQSLKS